MGEAPLFFEAGAALFVERALARKQTFLPAGQEHVVEFEPFRRMQRHQRQQRRPRRRPSRSITSEMCSRKPCRFSNSSIERTSSLRFSSRPAASGGTVLLPHLGVAALVEYDFGELGMHGHFALRAPTIELTTRSRRALRAFGFSSSVSTTARAASDAECGAAGMVVQHLQGSIAETALGT